MTKSQMKFVAESYAKYFGRAADADTIKEYGLKENGKPEKTSEILKNIIADAKVEKTGLGTEDFVNNAFQNLFNRNADTIEMNKYSKVVEKGKDLPINSIVKSAAKTDKAVYNNKMAVAVKYAELGGTEPLELNKISKGNLIGLNFLNTVTKAADLKAKIETLADKSGIPSSFDGKTFVLTEGVNAGKDFTGTNKDDLFVADNSVGDAKTSAADTLDGGKGEDTFKLYENAGTTTITAGSLPTLKNIENVALYNLRAGDLDVKKWDTVETLYVVNAKAAAGTGLELGEKVTTVNFEDIAAADQIVTFDKALTAATLGVNKVNVNGANTITVNGTALKTLTVDASGKASNVTLTQATGAIETLNITGRADLDLTLTAGTLGTTVKTVDGSKAEGKLVLSKLATMTSVKTGSGNDTVTVAAAASGDTINLGAGNDKLVKGAGSVAAGSTIDGGAGIDSLDSTLVTVGNAGVFANFETISLTTATGATALDLDLLTKSTITSIAKDADNAHTLLNVKKSQALTVNTTTTAATTLVFKDVAGTADAYTINFAKDAAVALGTTVAAGTVTIDGIETVTVNSTGKTTTTGNSITLNDKDAKSLVITGDKDLTVAFNTAFGTAATTTNGLGVSTIDASASTAGITIGALTAASNLKVAYAGLTIKGGAGDDNIDTGAIAKTEITALTIDSGAGNDTLDLSDITVVGGLTKADIKVNAGAGNDDIIVGTIGGTFTLGTGNDTIDVTKAVAAGTTVATGAITTTITDIGKGDVIEGLNGTLFAQANINGANNLDAALLLAAAGAAGTTTWFQYAGKTYIVDDKTAGAFATTDIVVELNGTVNLGNSTFDAGADTLTIG